MDRLTPCERSCWLTLLCLASTSGKEGVIQFLTEEALLRKAGIVWDPYSPEDWEQTKGVLGKFQALGLISLNENGEISLINWTKRQESNLTNAERQARFREKNKESNAPRNESNARIEENRREDIITAQSADFTIQEVKEDGEPRKSKKTTQSANAEYEEGLQWAEKRTGRKFVNRVKQYSALKKAKASGIGIAKLVERWKELEGDPFYQEHGLDWMMVLSSFDKRV